MHSRIANLLKKSAFNSIKSRAYQPIKTQPSLYDGMFAYTLKNKGAHLQFDFNLGTPAVQALRTAIRIGKADAEVFSDRYCHHYLLYLIKNNHIEFWQGITVYAYLMALMQFTNKQPLHPNDLDLKNPSITHHGVQIEYLSKDNQVTPFGKKYFAETQARLKKLQIKIDAERFFQFAAGLSPVDSWVFKCNYANVISPYLAPYDNITRIIIYNSPCVFYETEKFISYFYTPSFQVLRHLLQQISPRPLEFQPILGKISHEDFYLLHQEDFHPVALYDPDNENNLVAPHGVACGPYTTMLHDAAGHTVWGSLLTPEERESIFSIFIPECKKVLSAAESYPLDKNKLAIVPMFSLVEKFERAVINATDFDLTDLEIFNDPTTRFWRYLARTFGDKLGDFLYPSEQKKNYYPRNLALGDCQEDHIYFLLKKHFYLCIAPQQPTGLWKSFLTYLEKNTSNDAQLPEILTALDVLARLVSGQEIASAEKKTKIDWRAWQLLLEKAGNSASLWNIAKCKRPRELLALITEYHLAFFPPLYLLSTEQMHAFKEFVDTNIDSDNTMTWPEFVNNMKKPIEIKP
jgi:hypothetical protein